MFYQARRTRLDGCEREASALHGIARMLVHFRNAAIEARAEKRKIERWPAGHPAEPSTRYFELAEVVRKFPMEAVLNEVAFEALLQARRASREMELLVGPEAELDVNQQHGQVFANYLQIIDDQIKQVREEAERRKEGEPPMQAASGV